MKQIRNTKWMKRERTNAGARPGFSLVIGLTALFAGAAMLYAQQAEKGNPPEKKAKRPYRFDNADSLEIIYGFRRTAVPECNIQDTPLSEIIEFLNPLMKKGEVFELSPDLEDPPKVTLRNPRHGPLTKPLADVLRQSRTGLESYWDGRIVFVPLAVSGETAVKLLHKHGMPYRIVGRGAERRHVVELKNEGRTVRVESAAMTLYHGGYERIWEIDFQGDVHVEGDFKGRAHTATFNPVQHSLLMKCDRPSPGPLWVGGIRQKRPDEKRVWVTWKNERLTADHIRYHFDGHTFTLKGHPEVILQRDN